jgi:hypothetical protein
MITAPAPATSSGLVSLPWKGMCRDSSPRHRSRADDLICSALWRLGFKVDGQADLANTCTAPGAAETP